MEVSSERAEHPQIRAIVIFIILMACMALVINFVITSDNIDRNALDKVVPTKDDILPDNFNFNNLVTAQDTSQIEKVFLHKYPIMKQMANKITDFYCIEENDDYCKVRSIVTYIKANIRLIYWETNIQYENPITTIMRSEGDFDALNIVFANLAKASGLETKLVLVDRRSFVLVRVNNPPPDIPLEKGWMRVDAACKTCLIGSIDFEHKIGRQVFELTD